MAPYTSAWCVLFFAVNSATSYQFYQYNIPNGDRVNHPCFPNKLWWGVGHFNQAGGGPTNQFGLDFKTNGYSWTEELCRKDSDGDGRTNGEELGDPNCLWKKDMVAERTSNLTHPGVCEPHTSEKCKRINGDWNLCVSNEFDCPAIKKDGVTNFTVKYTRTRVPSKVTNYFCQAFEMPTDDTYHMIASKPTIDNANMMHHILVFGCESKPDDVLFQKPRSCGMGGSNCHSIITIWGLGYLGDCLPEQFGILVGKMGYKHVVLQYHWNNPAMLDNEYDETSMTFYLTKSLRANNGGVFMAGQRYLEIQSGKDSVIQTSVCSKGCTKARLPHKIYFTDIIAHMHYAGRKAEMLLYRNGSLVRTILPNSEVRYDEPKKFILDPPVEVFPGDELVIHCDFRTTGLANTIYYGDSTQDEMCYMFLNYYPQQSFVNCVDYGKVDMCTLNSVENGGDGMHRPGWIDDCNVGDFYYKSLPTKWMPRVIEFCDVSIDACRTSCLEVVKDLYKEEVCWKGWPKKYLDFASSWGGDFDAMKRLRLSIAPCERELAVQEVITGTDAGKGVVTPGPGSSNGRNNEGSISVVMIVMGAMVLAMLAAVTVVGLIRAFKQGSQIQSDNKKIIDGKVSSAYDNRSYEMETIKC